MPRNRRGPLILQGGGRGRRGLRASFNVLHTAIEQISPASSTLVDEARRTLKHDHSSWENTKLRKLPVGFISAGTIDPSHPVEKSLIVDVQTSLGPGQGSATPLNNKNAHFSHKKQERIDIECARDDTEKGEGGLSHIHHLKTREPKGRNITPVLERHCSPDSSSDGEEILFQGRNKTKKQSQDLISLETMHTELQNVEEQIYGNASFVNRNITDDFLSVGPKRRQRQRQSHRLRSDKNAVYADYIANLQENGQNFGLRSRGARKQREPIESNCDSDDSPSSFLQGLWEQEGEPIDISIARTIGGTAKKHDDTEESAAEDGLLSLSALENVYRENASLGMIAGRSPSILDGEPSINPPSQLNASDSELETPLDQGDSINDFDLMDWERPSLRKRKGKGSQAVLQLHNSDSELELKLQAAWKNDRMKKAQRKKLRKDLRESGILGKKSKSPDLRTQYQTGMSLPQVAEELKAFLLCVDDSLSLPPMDTHGRKIVHELASKFNLKSKSTGQGDQRRITLYRTKRTLEYNDFGFGNVFKRIDRKYFPRLDTQNKQRRMAPTRHSAANIRDGEIVGAAAPELGIENRGRAMLEKMGWSTGTALGASDNKGILQPVTHTVKRSKAGLG